MSLLVRGVLCQLSCWVGGLVASADGLVPWEALEPLRGNRPNRSSPSRNARGGHALCREFTALWKQHATCISAMVPCSNHSFLSRLSPTTDGTSVVTLTNDSVDPAWCRPAGVRLALPGSSAQHTATRHLLFSACLRIPCASSP